MRSLAQRLESGTATLYRHFSGRAELVAQVIDAVVGEIRLNPANLQDLPWQEACETTARAMFDVLRRHPGVAPLMVENIPVGPNALAQRERALTLLLSAGFSPAVTVQAWATLARFVLGFAIQLTTRESHQVAPAAWSSVDFDEFPATLAVAAHVPIALESEFDFGLELLINGLSRHLDRR